MSIKVKDVVATFQSSYSEEVYDRKAREVSKLLEDRPDGFSYKELKELTQLTTFVLYDLSKGYAKEMKGPFIQLLQKAKLGFKKEKMFDDRIMFLHISEFLNTLAPILYNFNYLIDVDHSFEEPKVQQKDLVEIKFAVIEFLYQFLKEDITKIKETKNYEKKIAQEAKENASKKLFEKKLAPIKDNSSNEREFEEHKKNYMNDNVKVDGSKNFRALYNSDLPEALVYFLQHNSNNYELNVLVLEVLNLSVMYRELVKKFCSVGLLKDIVGQSNPRYTMSSTRKKSSGPTRSDYVLRSCGTP